MLDALLSVGRRIDIGSSLSRTAAYTLATLDALGPSRVTDLAEREAVSQPAMTGLVQRLQASGHVRRDADPADGRSVLVGLTDAGRALVAERRLAYADAVARLVDRLDADEQQALQQALPALRRLTELAYEVQPMVTTTRSTHHRKESA